MSFRECRLKAGFKKLTEAARALGVSTATVCRWEQGSRMPTITKALEVARVYGVTLDVLLGESEADGVKSKQQKVGLSPNGVKRERFNTL